MSKKNMTKNRIQAPPPPKGETAGIIFKTLFLCLIIAVAAGGWFLNEWVDGVLAQTPDLDPELIIRTQSALIHDREGELIMEFGVELSEWVSFDEISPVMIDAILAIEDSRFFEHYGVDWSRTIAAVIYTLDSFIRGGTSMQGGSTLTQQLINQTHLLMEDGERDNSLERKLQEVLLAIQIEQIYSKEQILEAYLNIAPFGGRIYGIQAAARFYFGVDASQLNLSQAATLAGLVQQPSVFRPDWNAHHTQNRRNEVLNMMYRHGFITATIRDLVRAEPLTDLLIYDEAGIGDRHRYEPFINLVHEEARNLFGIEDISGHQIFTTLDRETQSYLYDLMMTDEHFSWPNEHIQTAAVILGNDGRIRALGNRSLQRNDGAQLGWNPAVHERRQVGSASKPIWAYGPAFEFLDWGTGSMIEDDLFGFDGSHPGTPLLPNHNNQYHGRVSVRDAMNRSWNVPAVRAYQAVVDLGGNHMNEFVNGLGIPTPENGFNQQHAVGGYGSAVSPLEMAGAYSAFANGGVFRQPFAIELIITPEGERIYGEQIRREERIMREESAYLMSSILRTAVVGSQYAHGTGGTARNSVPGDWWFAGKTGTTNFDLELRQQLGIPASGVPDAWFVGYSMQYTIAVWTGYQHLNSGHFLTFDDTQIPQRIFGRLVTEFNLADDSRPVRPDGIRELTVELQSGEYDGDACLPSEYTPSGTFFNRVELFQVRNLPECVSERFVAPEAPENLTVTPAGGLTLDFEWDHISNLPMTLEEATEAVATARAARAGETHITQEMLDISPREGEAQMIIDQINAIGETEYVLMGVLSDGEEIELGTTTSDYISVTLSMMDAINVRTFHVVTRFAASVRTSEPSNSVFNEYLIDLDNLELVLENMMGWTRNELMEWLAAHPDVSYEIIERHSNFVPLDQIISYTPSFILRLDQVLVITISLGAGTDDWLGVPGTPGGGNDPGGWGTPPGGGGGWGTPSPGDPGGGGWGVPPSDGDNNPPGLPGGPDGPGEEIND